MQPETSQATQEASQEIQDPSGMILSSLNLAKSVFKCFNPFPVTFLAVKIYFLCAGMH